MLRLIVSALMIAVLAGCSKEGRRDAHLRDGRAQLQAGNIDAARRHLIGAIQIDPRSGPAWIELGELQERVGNVRESFAAYTHATEVAPNLPDGYVGLGRLALMFGDSAKAADYVRQAAQIEASQIEVRALQAAVLVAQGQPAPARAEVQRILAERPGSPPATTVLARVLAREGDINGALMTLRQAIQAHPTHIGLRTELVVLEQARGDIATIEAALRDLLQIEPRSAQARAGLVNLLAANGRVDEAERLLRQAQINEGDEETATLALAELQAQRRGVDVARQTLEQAARERPRAWRIKLALARLYEQGLQPTLAESLYGELIAKTPDTTERVTARLRLAQRRLAAGRPDEADALLTEAIRDAPRETAALTLRAQLALSRQHFDRAIGDLRSILKDQPESAEHVGLLAWAHLANGAPALAREALAQLATRLPNLFQARSQYAVLLAGLGEYGAALREAEAAMRHAPTHLALSELRARITQALQARPADVQPPLAQSNPDLLLAQLHNVAGRASEAAARFEAAYRRNSDSLEATNGWFAALAAQRKYDLLAQQARQAPTTDAARRSAAIFWHATALAGQGKQDEAATEFKRAIAAQPRWAMPYVALSNLQTAMNNQGGAIQTIDQGLRVLPDDPILLYTRAQAHEAAGESERALAIYEPMFKRYPDFDPLANNVANLLLDRSDDPASHQRAVAIAQRFAKSNVPAFADTYGWSLARSGRAAQSVQILRRAAEAMPQRASIWFHLGAALAEIGQSGGAKSALQKAIALDQSFPGRQEARKILATL